MLIISEKKSKPYEIILSMRSTVNAIVNIVFNVTSEVLVVSTRPFNDRITVLASTSKSIRLS
jgi:hypothetical protein